MSVHVHGYQADSLLVDGQRVKYMYDVQNHVVVVVFPTDCNFIHRSFFHLRIEYIHRYGVTRHLGRE